MNQDLHKASELFEYDKPNDQYEGQRHLQVELIKSTSVASGKYLDFGVGGNLGIADELQRIHPLHEFHSCDLYPLSKQGYFQMYSPVSPFGSFDGISSNAVVEHLDNTLEAWRYLNRLLRPISEGGGLMIHAFPSQLVEDPGHWAIRIESHECLFSKESLNLVCEKSGFKFAKMRYFTKVQHPVYYFRKTRDWK